MVIFVKFGLKVVERLLLFDLMNIIFMFGKCVIILFIVFKFIDVFLWIVVCG